MVVEVYCGSTFREFASAVVAVFQLHEMPVRQDGGGESAARTSNIKLREAAFNYKNYQAARVGCCRFPVNCSAGGTTGVGK